MSDAHRTCTHKVTLNYEHCKVLKYLNLDYFIKEIKINYYLLMLLISYKIIKKQKILSDLML